MTASAIAPACALISALALPPGVAHADGAGVITPAGPERAAVAAAVADAMSGRARRIVPDAVAEARAALAAGAVPVEALVAFRRVREQIDEGWRAYLRVAAEVAARRLASARTDAEALVALPGGAELYADAALRLGAVLGHLGRRDEAEAVLALALALDPDRPVTSPSSPPTSSRPSPPPAPPRPRAALRVATTPPARAWPSTASTSAARRSTST